MIIRLIDISDVEKISAFRIKNFPVRSNYRSHTPEYYRWKYSTNYTNTKPIVAIAEDKGDIIGLFGIIPKKYKFKDEIIIVGEMVDGFLREDYQKKGIFVKLANMVFEQSEKQGINQLYGAPNEVAFPVWKMKYGFKEPFKYEYLVRPIIIGQIINRYSKFTHINKILGSVIQRIYDMFYGYASREDQIEFHRVHKFDTRIDGFLKRLSSEYDYMIYRDHSYLNWRYVDNPENYDAFVCRKNRTIFGYCVLKYSFERNIKIGHIVELLTRKNDLHNSDIIIRKILNIFKNNGVGISTVLLPKNTKLYSIYRTNGFVDRKMSHHFVVRYEHPKYDVKVNINNWLFQVGDTDDI